MTSPVIARLTATALVLAGGLAAGSSAIADGPLVEQTFDLRPGWNAIYFEVRPEPNDIEAVFAGLPVASVWTWQPRTSPVEFVRDPSEGLLNRPGWLGYFPAGNPEEFLTNLFAVQAHRAYLVRLHEEAGPARLTVAGRPVLRPREWVPNSFNLVGLPVDPARPPSFGTFFGPSRAHRGQPVYRLDPEGRWQRVLGPFSETIRHGEAYWVYTEGASRYAGPLEVEVEFGDGLDFGANLTERRLRVRDASGDGGGFVIRRRSSRAPVPLAYWNLETRTDPDTGEAREQAAWPDLGAEHGVELAGDDETVVRLAVRRSRIDQGEPEVEEVLEITDDFGTRHLVPVVAVKRGLGGAGPAVDPHAGLWVGNVVVDGVSEVRKDPASVIPTGSEFAFRVMIHVDGTGVSRLLEQVYQMWDPPVLDSEGNVVEPGGYVLITDDARLSEFRPSSVRDGDPVSYRISTAAYDLDGTELESTSPPGSFGASLAFDLLLAPDAATNPFRHAFHPDHDDDVGPADIDADPTSTESAGGLPYEIARDWTMEFAARDPAGLDPPEWGDSLVGGSFSETLTGLHREPIAVQGTFRLWRVSEDPELNPEG